MSRTVQPERVQLGDGAGLKQGVSVEMERFRDFSKKQNLWDLVIFS